VDPVTQAALGGVMGELVLGRKLGWRGVAWGLGFGILPDLDLFLLPFVEEAERIRVHRGLSHSIFAMVVAALIFAKPLSLLHRRRGLTTKEAGWFVFLVWSTHVLIDVFTSYGTQIYEPFSDERVAWSNFFIIDFFFTLPMLVGLIWVLFREPGSAGRRRIMWRAFSLSCLYVVFSFVMKLWAIDQIKTRLADEIPGGDVVSVAPTPFNTLLWRGLIETDEAYWATYWSPFDEKPGKYEFIPKQWDLLKKFEGQDHFESLKWFSKGHWVARELDDGKLVLVDVRFGEMRDLEEGKISPRFRWHLYFDEAGVMRAPRYVEEIDPKPMLGLLLERIRGKQDRWESMKEF